MSIDRSRVVMSAGLVVIGYALVTGKEALIAVGAGVLGLPGVLQKEHHEKEL